MPQLIETKKKITSVQNTQKITKAMELVAANKMRQFQKLAVASKEYSRDLMSGLRLAHGSFGDLEFAKTREEGKRLFVVVTSDKGLCGALNQRILREVFESSEWKGAGKAGRLYMAVGRKANEAARNREIPVAHSFEGLREQMTPLEAIEIVDKILSFWDDGSVNEIYLVSPDYVNAFTYNVKLTKFLPFSEEMATEDEDEASDKQMKELGQLFFEPDEPQVLDALTRQVTQMQFLAAFYELKATEYSSRMIAMRNATDAAGDIINDLTLDYNKARQAAITQQLAEIIGAVDAMN